MMYFYTSKLSIIKKSIIPKAFIFDYVNKYLFSEKKTNYTSSYGYSVQKSLQ